MIQFDDDIFQMGWNHQPIIYYQFWSPLSQESSIGRFLYYRDRTDLVPQDLWSIATPGISKETTPAPRFCWQDLPHITLLRLMEEILHHRGCIKSCKSWDIYQINWCRFLPSTVSYPHLFLFGRKTQVCWWRKFVYHLFFQINGLPGHLSQKKTDDFRWFRWSLTSQDLMDWWLERGAEDWWRSLDTQNLPLLGFISKEMKLFFWDVSFDWIFWITTASKLWAFSKSRCKVRVLKANNSEKDANAMLHHCLKTK